MGDASVPNHARSTYALRNHSNPIKQKSPQRQTPKATGTAVVSTRPTAPDRVSSSAAHHLATAKQRGRERGQTRAEKSGVRAHLCHGGHGEDGHQEQRAAPPHHRRHLRSPRARRPSPTEPARAPAGGDLEGSGRGVASARREVGVGELKRRRRATNAQASREE